MNRSVRNHLETVNCVPDPGKEAVTIHRRAEERIDVPPKVEERSPKREGRTGVS